MIYLVVGDTGEYSDHTQWNVCYYTNRKDAEEHARKANVRAKELRPDRWKPGRGANQYDPNMRLDYTGTSYGVEEVAEGACPP